MKKEDLKFLNKRELILFLRDVTSNIPTDFDLQEQIQEELKSRRE